MKDRAFFGAIIWIVYFGVLQILSWALSESPLCILISEKNQAKNQAGDDTHVRACATLFEDFIRGIRYLWDHADSDALTAVSTLLIAVFTFTLYRSTTRLWEASERQIRLARDDFEATHRPWVSVKISIGPRGIYFDDNGMNLHLIFVCKNGGTTPAISAWVAAEPYLDRQGRQDLEEQRRVCDSIRKRPYHPKAPGKTIFPGDEEIFSTIYTFIGKDDLETQAREDYGFVHPIIVGCVDYMFTFGERIHHQTGFIYHVHKIKSPNLGRFAIRPEDGDIAPQNIGLSSPTLNSGGFFAD
jgi:hypothetical protein